MTQNRCTMNRSHTEYPRFSFLAPGLLLAALLISPCLRAQQRNLSYYQQQAMAQNPGLKDYSNQLALGSTDSLMLNATQKPQVNANGQIWIEPDIHQYGYDKAITNGGNYSAQMSVSQPLFNKAIMQPKYQSIEIQKQGIRAGIRVTKAQLERDITNAYILAYSDQRQLDYNREVLSLLRSQSSILQRMVQHGIYKQLDFLNFRGTVQTQELATHQIYMQSLNDLGQLNALCGIRDTAFTTLTDPTVGLLAGHGPDSSIFLKSFLIDSLSLDNQESLFLTKYKPNLSWFADAGLLSSNLNYAYRNFGASFGLNFTVPIYDGRQRRIYQDQTRIKQETRKNYESFFKTQRAQQLEVLYQQLRQNQSLISETQQKLLTARQVIRVSNKELQAGNLPISDYLLSIRNLLDIENSLNQELVSSYQILNALNYWNQ